MHSRLSSYWLVEASALCLLENAQLVCVFTHVGHSTLKCSAKILCASRSCVSLNTSDRDRHLSLTVESDAEVERANSRLRSIEDKMNFEADAKALILAFKFE